MTDKALQIQSLLREDQVLEVRLAEVPVPTPAADEVLVRVEAAPINPSDLGLLFGAADMSTARATGTAELPVIEADVPASAMHMMAGRLGQALPVGNEGAGTVVAAGDDGAAQALLGRTVGVFGGELYSQYRCVKASQCLPLHEGTTAEQGASCFVNPMTALGMVETMTMEGHKALVHTAAASNLGQMLNRICLADGVPLVNIVRKAEQAALLRELGARHVVNSSADSFVDDLTAALRETGATLAFDAIGGGRLASTILGCMEAVAVEQMGAYSRYGSDVFKQVYVYGALDFSPTTLNRNFGFAWALGGWLLPNFLQRAGGERMQRMQRRVADELTSTFASHYTARVSLAEALSLEALAVYGRQATGQKFLISPQR
ncbi:zinc-binding dehydrogenase [Pseudohaliea rubra]|uniref:Putative NADH oxidoreductase n=1 Tax=Pseudohaliea rubra DSM 19751 TaxID=1265313 RepID=A0A095WW85_9GAMM|nr:zinc-binding dehydrogenase [Pseudohaliea rubra]KGE02909.1 putative NADH oxidoreductase [Pseudohaliea rubra DSM 19751]